MKEAPVIWRPEARSDLLALYDWIAERADPFTALEYTSKVEAHAETLSAFPHRGTPHDDRKPGFRTISYRRRTVIAYRVEDGGVEIIRIFHAGQDWGPE